MHARFNVAAAATALVLSSSLVSATQPQAGSGADYGARDPHVCKDKTLPTHGAPSVAQAVEYIQCEREGPRAKNLYLVEAVKIEIGAGRPYSAKADPGLSDVDPKSPVYPLTGSYQEYQCEPMINNPRVPQYNNVGKNCTLRTYPKASGGCWKTLSGEWRCDLGYEEADPNPKRNVAPPGRGGN